MRFLAVLAIACLSLSLVGAHGQGRETHAQVERLGKRWVAAVSRRDPIAFELLSRSGREYYPRMRQLALHGDMAELQELDTIDQLQVLFLRLMVDPAELREMNPRELLMFAIGNGFIGMNLRSRDVLREIVVEDDRARGRLDKFGIQTRPDTGHQYFRREDGSWRVELRGERDRLRSDFQAFLARSGLSESEAAFFILEMRLMRKVTVADFAAPMARGGGAPAHPAPRVAASEPVLRLVAIRKSLSSAEPSTVTLEDRRESLRYLLRPGDSLPAHAGYQLIRVEGETAVLTDGEGAETVLRLELGGAALNQRPRVSSKGARRTGPTLLDLAAQGADRKGLMAQWRNVGLRDRPLLLQQGSLTPVFPPQNGTHERMLGLRVRELVAGSFWEQLGARPGDLLTALNGRPIDSMEAWQDLMRAAENDLALTITVERESKRLSFLTHTIRPR